MTQKEARKIMLWKAIERYRTAGGREEHFLPLNAEITGLSG